MLNKCWFAKFNKVIFCFYVMIMKNVLLKELELISVSKSEVLRLKKIAADFIKSLKREGLRAFVGGSLAKGTMIRKALLSENVRCQVSGVREEKQDVDVFVVFDYSEDILKLEGILKKMKLPGVLKKVHGSRDYFHVVCDPQLDSFGHQMGQGVILEVVPVVKNRDPELAENVTDVSLSHVRYVGSEVRKNPRIADEIRLAKAFCRAHRCYGAEGYVRGFSGYSLEILVIYFGGFLKFLKGLQKFHGGSVVRWFGGSGDKGSVKIIVDPMKYFKGEREIMRELNSSKLQGPVVVVDPTYKFRNVCAGLGLSTFERFLEVGSEFLRKPSLEFFERRDVDVEALRALAVGSRKSEVGSRKFLELELSTDRQEGDIAGTKMRKIFGFFVRELERKGQKVLRSEFDYSGEGKKARGYLVVREVGEIEVRGPSIGLEKEGEEFCRAKGDAVFRRKGFWWAKKKVSVEDILKFVKGFEGEMGASINLF